MRRAVIESPLLGTRHGRLRVVREYRGEDGRSRFHCECDCGNKLDVRASSVERGQTSSCGCLRREVTGASATTHGEGGKVKTPEYHSWRGMRQRCFDPKHKLYHRYGGRGIQAASAGSYSTDSYKIWVASPPPRTRLTVSTTTETTSLPTAVGLTVTHRGAIASQSATLRGKAEQCACWIGRRNWD